MKITAQIALGVEVGCELIRGATGRATSYVTKEQQQQELLIKEWAQCTDADAILSHPGIALFEQLIDAASIFSTPIVAYRGRYRSADMTPHPMPRHFGPPPAELTKAGRYNTAGNPVLYLATSRHGVAFELRREDEPTVGLYCQEYVVDTTDLRVADFSDPRLDNFVHIAFEYAEYGLRDGGIDTRDYHFSKVIAGVVERQGFHGMIVPGVRGNPKHRYKNIVIFHPGQRWECWVNANRPPELIDDLPASIK
jgi:RES domain-containing protein